MIRMEGVTKQFAAVRALDNVSLDLNPGEVHVILGENGAGKSTLMKILSGIYHPDEGAIIVDGKAYARLTPHSAKELGISIVQQELSVVNTLSIMENIFMGRIPYKTFGRFKVVDNNKMEEQAREYMKAVKLEMSPRTLVANLSIAQKQMVEIAKVISINANVIILDEPTSSLAEAEIEKLFSIIRELRAQGKTIVYISHKLKEIQQIGDCLTVLKDGQFVAHRRVADTSLDQMVSLMVGRDIKVSRLDKNRRFDGEPIVFEVKNLTRRDGKVRNIAFHLRRGEILGFSGLVGAGRSETMEAIFGVSRKASGEILLEGKPIAINSTNDALCQGLGMVTENRRENGYFFNFSIANNIVISKRNKDARKGTLRSLNNSKKDVELAESFGKQINIVCSSYLQNIMELSGGNQQKVIVAKWLSSGAKVLIMDEPTKGIDVGAKSEIYELIQSLADAGIGIIVVSSELPELLSICNRIIVMKAGEITAEFHASEATEENLVAAATI